MIPLLSLLLLLCGVQCGSSAAIPIPILPHPPMTLPAAEPERGLSLDAVAPPIIPSSGGVPVTISGTDFENGAAVFFDETESAFAVIQSANRLYAMTPPLLGTQGPVMVTIRNPSGAVVARKDLLRVYATQVSMTERHQVGTGPAALTLADLDGDQLPDAITANLGTGNISVLRGQPDGSFGLARSYPVGPNPRAVSGSFAAPLATATGILPQSLALRDINRDGKIDVITVSTLNSLMSIQLGKGNGTFNAPSFINLPNGAIALVCQDVTGDGIPDVLTAHSSTSSLNFFGGIGDGRFYTPVPLSSGRTPSALSTIDLNSDRIDDIVITNYLDNNLNVLLSGPPGSLQFLGSEVSLDTGSLSLAPARLQLFDLDSDGRQDLAAFGTNSGVISLLYGSSSGFFERPKLLGLPFSSNQSFIFDIDHSGWGDILVPFLGDRIYIYTGLPDRSFLPPVSIQIAEPLTSTPSTSIQAVDVNGDGRPDLVKLAPMSVGILLADRTGTYLPELLFSANPNSRSVNEKMALGDLNGDGKTDIVAMNGAGDVSALLGVGDGTFQPALFSIVGGRPQNVILRDIDQDGRADLLVSLANLFYVSIFRGLGNGSFEPTNTLYGNGVIRGTALDDLNGDGRDDLVIVDSGVVGPNPSIGGVGIFLGDGRGSFGAIRRFLNSSTLTAVTIIDFNSDGRKDIVAANETKFSLSILYNDSQ